MTESAFADFTTAPTDDDLARVLGPAQRHWNALVDEARAASPGGTAAWKHYPGRSGWTFVIRDRRRNLLYLKAGSRRFTVHLALREPAVQAAAAADLPAPLVAAIQASPKYPEGRAVHLDVKGAADLAIARKLLALKLQH